jgi:hypothetical protein
MIIIISLKKLGSTQKKNIRKHYSLLEFDKGLHITNTIDAVGEADVLLFELDLSLFFNIKNNVLYKYLQAQDLTKFKIVWVYDSTKYKGLFSGAKFNIRKLPMLVGRSLLEAVEVRAEFDEENKSTTGGISSEDMKDFMISDNPVEHKLEKQLLLKEDGVSVFKIEDSISKLRDINTQLQKLTLEFEKFADQFDELKKEALLIVPPNSPEQRQKNFITDGGDAFKVFSNGNVVATFKYSSDKQKRKANRLSQRKLNSL